MITTTIQWYNAADALPAKSGAYLVFTGAYITNVEYSSKHHAFNTMDEMEDETAEMVKIPCKYWAKLPELPKTESEGV
jgi:hypothetical protein